MFHPWTLIYLISGIFCLLIGIHTLRASSKPWSRRFLASMLFIFAIWPILEFFMNLVDDMTLAELFYEIDILILSFVFFIFLLIPYSMLRDVDRKVLGILAIPVLVDIVLIIYGGVLTGVEYEGASIGAERTEPGVETPYNGPAGVGMYYNEPVFAFWCVVGIIALLTAYVLFYFAYKEIEKPGFKRRIKIFCAGCGIVIVFGYFLDTYGTIVLGLPPLGSASAAVGMAIASLAFRKH